MLVYSLRTHASRLIKFNLLTDLAPLHALHTCLNTPFSNVQT
jgi:hypothetical protein